MNRSILEMYLPDNAYAFVLFRTTDKKIPGRTKDMQRRSLLKQFKTFFPYLCQREKRIMQDQHISFVKKSLAGNNYSFSNTESGISWMDFKVFIGPLILTLMREQKEVSFSEIRNRFFIGENQDNGNVEIEVNWEEVLDFIEERNGSQFQKHFKNETPIPDIKLIEVMDKCYDEIKITLIKPDSYHRLFRWFGEDTIEIGYKAFDAFTECRDGEKAWRIALKSHLDSYNLEIKFEEELLNAQLYPILKF